MKQTHETDMLEQAVNKIAGLFDVHSDNTGNRKKSKADRMLTGSKTTEIVTDGAVYKINVEESAKTLPNVKSGRELLRQGTPRIITPGKSTNELTKGMFLFHCETPSTFFSIMEL